MTDYENALLEGHDGLVKKYGRETVLALLTSRETNTEFMGSKVRVSNYVKPNQIIMQSGDKIYLIKVPDTFGRIEEISVKDSPDRVT